jgi:hypothetical protein
MSAAVPSFRGADEVREPGIHIHSAGAMDSGLLAALGPGMTYQLADCAWK